MVSSGPYSLLVCTSYSISSSVHAQFIYRILSFENGTGGIIGILQLFVLQLL